MSSPVRGRSRMRWTRWRRSCQLVVALLYLLIPLVNRAGYHQVSGTLAALKIGSVEIIEPAGALSAILAGRQVAATVPVGIIPVVLLALLAGPVFCSWICPWGLVSELVDKVRSRGGKHRWVGAPWVAVRKLRAGSILFCATISAGFAVPLIAIIAPPRLITSLPLEAIALKTLAPVTGGLILLLLAFELVGPRRLWCRALCPIGAVTNFLRLPPVMLRIISDAGKCRCTSTALCHVQCAWGIDPRRIGQFDGCTNCMRCVEACPSAALSITC